MSASSIAEKDGQCTDKTRGARCENRTRTSCLGSKRTTTILISQMGLHYGAISGTRTPDPRFTKAVL